MFFKNSYSPMFILYFCLNIVIKLKWHDISEYFREGSYGSDAMDNTSNIHHIPKNQTETSSPSSALEADPVIDMEITIANIHNNTDNDNGRLPDVVVENKIFEDNQIQETYLSIAIQVFIPFLIAGFGMVFAGLVLDKIRVIMCDKY